MMNNFGFPLKVGQRWQYKSYEAEFVAEIVSFINETNVTIKILYANKVSYGWSAGVTTVHTLHDSHYSLLIGQEAPIL